MIKGGYIGRILRVDLTRQTIKDEDLPDEATLRKHIGGLGLAAKYLYEEVPPSVQPLDAENPLIFLTGPLTGTMWPSSSRYIVVTVSADLPISCGAAWGGGFWAAKLKMSGYDGIIVQGKANKPTYLLLQSGKPELRDASHLWGKDTHETEEFLREELGDPLASVAAIGPAGENVVPGALIANDRNHVAAKAGAGMIMGSKRLKCIAIAGRMVGVPVADAEGLRKHATQYRKTMIPGGAIQQLGHDAGIVSHYNQLADGWKIAVKNFSDPFFQKQWGDEMVNTVKQSTLIPRPCFNCPISCAPTIIIGKGPYKGFKVTIGGGAENMEGVGGMVGVMEGGTVLYITDLCDRLGLETGLIGQSIALLYECYEKGMIDRKFTDGLELKWGNADAAIALIHKTVKREGVGKLIAEGTKAVVEAIGRGAEELVMHYKWLSFAHDYRGSWELILGKAVSNTGVAIESHGMSGWFKDADVDYTGGDVTFDKEGAPLGVFITTRMRTWENCLGGCRWSTWTNKGALAATLEALRLAVGWEPITKEEAFSVSERTLTMLRLFNLRRGLTVRDDLNIGKRLLDGYQVGPLAGHSIRPHFKAMVQSYYKLMGWDTQTSIPTEETLKRLGLNKLIKDQKRLARAKGA